MEGGGRAAPHQTPEEETLGLEIIEVKKLPVLPFVTLPPQLNLNVASPHWLQSNPYTDYYSFSKHSSSSQQHSQSLSSTLVISGVTDEIHFISSLSDFKSLYTLPYTKQSKTQVIHRLGKTLIVDSLKKEDVKHTLKSLKEMRVLVPQLTIALPGPLEEHGGGGGGLIETSTARKVVSRSYEEDIESKLLYHTIERSYSSSEEGEDFDDEVVGDERGTLNINRFNIADMSVLISSNMPIFGNNEHPSVSLKLCDVNKPITQKVGLDLYLSNIFLNVPELALCLHDEGVVKDYRLLKTQDIPFMGGGGSSPLFDPHEAVMKGTALLKFLQENCDSDYDSFLLLKGAGEKTLKLYNLSKLYAQANTEETNEKLRKYKYLLATACLRFSENVKKNRATLLSAVGGTFSESEIKGSLDRERELLLRCLSILEELSDNGSTQNLMLCSNVHLSLALTYRDAVFLHDKVNAPDSPTAVDSLRLEILNAMLNHLQQAAALLKKEEERHEPTDDALFEMLIDNQKDITSKLYQCHLQLCKQLQSENQFVMSLHHLDMALYLQAPNAETTALLGDLMFHIAIFNDPNITPELPKYKSLYSLLSEFTITETSATETQSQISSNNTSSGSSALVDAKERYLRLCVQCYKTALNKIQAVSSSSDETLTTVSLSRKLGNSYNELGRVCLSVGRVIDGETLFKEGVQMFLSIKDQLNASLLMMNLAHMCKSLALGRCENEGLTKEVIKSFEDATDLCFQAVKMNPSLDRELAMLNLIFGLKCGEASVHILDWNNELKVKTIKLLNASLKTYESINDAKQVAAVHYQLGRFYSSHGFEMLKTKSLSAEQMAATKARLKIGMNHLHRSSEIYKSMFEGGELSGNNITIVLLEIAYGCNEHFDLLSPHEPILLQSLQSLLQLRRYHSLLSDADLATLLALAQLTAKNLLRVNEKYKPLYRETLRAKKGSEMSMLDDISNLTIVKS